MTTITITEHKQFDFQTQLRLDELWASWSIFDRTGDYLNELWCQHSDELWERYQTALDTAYRAKASAEADEIVARHGDSIRKQIGIAGFQQLSRNLTAVSRQMAVR